MTVARMGEFGLIARVTARLDQGASCLLGPGDDGAVVSAPDRRVVVSTDVLVEGRHFRRDWSSARDVGHRAAAANLADIAAMGAMPTALLVALCAPPKLEVAWAEELADGLGKRIEKEGPPDDAGRIAFAFRVCFARSPSSAEAERLQAYLEGRRTADPKTAWAAVARVLLNLDEFITRE